MFEQVEQDINHWIQKKVSKHISLPSGCSYAALMKSTDSPGYCDTVKRKVGISMIPLETLCCTAFILMTLYSGIQAQNPVVCSEMVIYSLMSLVQLLVYISDINTRYDKDINITLLSRERAENHESKNDSRCDYIISENHDGRSQVTYQKNEFKWVSARKPIYGILNSGCAAGLFILCMVDFGINSQKESNATQGNLTLNEYTAWGEDSEFSDGLYWMAKGVFISQAIWGAVSCFENKLGVQHKPVLEWVAGICRSVMYNGWEVDYGVY